jgi:hypothetical protein
MSAATRAPEVLALRADIRADADRQYVGDTRAARN